MIPGPETKIRKEILLRMPVGILLLRKRPAIRPIKSARISPRVHPANTAAALEKLCCV